MSAQTIYCTEEAFVDILLGEDEHPLLFKMITSTSNVILDIDDQKFDKLIQDGAVTAYMTLLQTQTFSSSHYFHADIVNQDLASFPIDIFILGLDESTCADLQDRHGVIVIPQSKLSLPKYLHSHHSFNLDKDTTYASNSHLAWSYLVKHAIDSPVVNSLVINDNYIFNDTQGVSNIINLLSAFFENSTLKAVIHLTIFFKNENGWADAKLLAYQQQLLDLYPTASVQLVKHKNLDLHKRFIVFNYHMIEAERGFNQFDCANGKARYENDFKVYGMFYSIENGNPYLTTFMRKLAIAKKEYLHALQLNQSTNGVIGSKTENRIFSVIP